MTGSLRRVRVSRRRGGNERKRGLSLLSRKQMSRSGESVTRTVPKDVSKKCRQGKGKTQEGKAFALF